MKNFWVRAASAVVYVALFLGSIYSGLLTGNKTLGAVILTAFLLFVACGCTFEFFRIVKQQGATPCQPLGYAYTVVALLTLAAIAYGSHTGYIAFGIAMTLLPMAFGVAAMVQLWNHSEQPFRDAAYTMVPMLYAAIPLGLMPMLHESYNVLVMVLIMVWMNDNGAYMGGSLLGKHKMWVRHSPGKTWEGTAIGVLVTLATAYFVGPLFNDQIAWYHWLALGFICSVIDTLGDLVESMLKRSVGMKDSGKIMPGHGGFLDRFDSLLIAVPVAFAYLAIFVRTNM
ncbi:MAG: phosphatidate cytidylyltransferase [Bacteroidales bacterium]|nr:phosphatidate cytidylyltransferase [Bacteroidales bacterium]